MINFFLHRRLILPTETSKSAFLPLLVKCRRVDGTGRRPHIQAAASTGGLIGPEIRVSTAGNGVIVVVNRMRLNQLSSGSSSAVFVSIKLFKMNKETASCSHVTPEPPQCRAAAGRGRRSAASTEMFAGDDLLWQDRTT